MSARSGSLAHRLIWPIAAASLLCACIALVLVFSWPWWVGFFLALLATSLLLGCQVLRKLWLRRREQQLVQADADGKSACSEAASDPDLLAAAGLEEAFKAGVRALRHSRLRRLGNALYSLPWYLMIGSCGSGKSSALKGAGLGSAAPESLPGLQLQSADQLSWWFLERGIILDLPGYHATPGKAAEHRHEWQKLLSLLLRYRRREPLNGVIVTVAADRLREAGKEQVLQEADAIRQRIDELTRAAGYQIPIYLLVTKCDLIPGLVSMCDRLPAPRRDEPVGVMNRAAGDDAASFVAKALDLVHERLRAIRLQLLPGRHAPDDTRDLLLSPEEFAGIGLGLTCFVEHAFGPSPYLDTPLLRGIFFGSGGGEAHDGDGIRVANDHRQDLPAARGGMFLHDLFTSVLPGDRGDLAPTGRQIKWRLVTANLGLSAWLVLGLALCGLLTFSFVKNLQTLRDSSQLVSLRSMPRGDLATELESLERFRLEILKVESRNRDWWLPRFGLTESIKVEQGLKERYCRQFRQTALKQADDELAARLALLGPGSSEEASGSLIVHLARRVNLIKAQLHGVGAEPLAAKPQPDFTTLAAGATGSPELAKRFGTQYLHYITWSGEPTALSSELNTLQSSLKRVLALKGGTLEWALAWMDRQSGLPPVTLREFWGGSQNSTGEKSVAPSFTRKGRLALQAMLAELEAALPASERHSRIGTDFVTSYRVASWDAWRAFAADFARGAGRLQGPVEWQQAAARIGSEQGAYFSFFDRLMEELGPAQGEAPLPAWLQQIALFQAARAGGLAAAQPGMGKVAESGKLILTAVRKNAGQEAGAKRLEAEVSAAQAGRDYCAALGAIAAAAVSRTEAFNLASRSYGEDPATGRSPCYTAQAAAARLKALGRESGADPLFVQLVDGPLDFLLLYLRKESAAHLQALWEQQVLAATLGMTAQQAAPVLLGPEGLVWRFVKGPAAPFLACSASGYRAKQALGSGIALENSLFQFLAKGAQTQAAVLAMGRPQSFSVGVKGLPTDSNAEARVRPHATRLEVQCGGTSQVLVNNNYPIGKTVTWSPETCGDVTLQIEVGDVVLTRHYLGPQGFPEFLRDMQGGRRTFGSREFPGERGALEKLGVKSVTVNYQFTGSAAVLKQAGALSGQPPRVIARGW